MADRDPDAFMAGQQPAPTRDPDAFMAQGGGQPSATPNRDALGRMASGAWDAIKAIPGGIGNTIMHPYQTTVDMFKPNPDVLASAEQDAKNGNHGQAIYRHVLAYTPFGKELDALTFGTPEEMDHALGGLMVKGALLRASQTDPATVSRAAGAAGAAAKAGGGDVLAGAAKTAAGYGLAKYGPAGEFVDALMGYKMGRGGLSQMARGAKSGFNAGREAWEDSGQPPASQPQAAGWTSAPGRPPVYQAPPSAQPQPAPSPAPAASAPPPAAAPQPAAQPAPAPAPAATPPPAAPAEPQAPPAAAPAPTPEAATPKPSLDEMLSALLKESRAKLPPEQQADFNRVPANQDRYDIGSNAPTMKPTEAKAAAKRAAKAAPKQTTDESLESDLEASVAQAKAKQPAAAPGGDYKPGDSVWLQGKGHVVISKINGDGTFDYAMGQ